VNDAQFEEQRRRVSVFVDKWKDLLAGGWKLRHEFFHGPFDIDGHWETEATVCIKSDWNYQTATLRWNLELVDGTDPAELEGIIVHELCHLFTAPLRAAADIDEMIGREEFATTLIERAILDVAQAASAAPAFFHPSMAAMPEVDAFLDSDAARA
jgi:hypothetical protein